MKQMLKPNEPLTVGATIRAEGPRMRRGHSSVLASEYVAQSPMDYRAVPGHLREACTFYVVALPIVDTEKMYLNPDNTLAKVAATIGSLKGMLSSIDLINEIIDALNEDRKESTHPLSLTHDRDEERSYWQAVKAAADSHPASN